MSGEREPGARRYRRFWGADPVRDADDELAFHVAMRVDEYRAAGMSDTDAEAAALARFGDVEGVRAIVHDIARQRVTRRRRAWHLDALRGDLRFAMRRLMSNPGYGAVLALTLALGIGANTAVFSVAYGVLVRPLPFREADRVVRLWSRNAKRDLEFFSVSPADFADWHNEAKSFSAMAAFERQRDATIEITSSPQTVSMAPVTTNVFAVLGAVPERGRAFTADDGARDAPAVAMISHELWATRFGADTTILQRSLMLDGRRFSVVGIMPPRFFIPGTTAALWTPLAIAAATPDRGNRYLRVLARLAPGVSPDRAHEELDAIAARVAMAFPNDAADWSTSMMSVRELIVGTQFRRALLTLVGVVAFVLLIACANGANLQLADSAARDRELAVRAALGASRGRIARQLFAENLVVSLVAGVLGIALAYGGVVVLRTLGAAMVPRVEDVKLDAPVLAFATFVALGSGMMVGMIPALRASSARLGDVLKHGGRGGGDSAIATGVRGALVIAEISLSLVLLVGAGLLLKSFVRLESVDLGFDARALWLVPVRLPEAMYPDSHAITPVLEATMARVVATGSATAVAAATVPPFAGASAGLTFLPEGQAMPARERPPDADYRVVTAGYLRAMGIRLLRGRDISPSDREGQPEIAVISATMANRYWPNEDPLGKRFRIGYLVAGPLVTIAGVAGDARYQSLETESTRPMIYLSSYARPQRSMVIVARASGDGAAASLTSAVASLDRRMPSPSVLRMEDLVASQMSTRRFALTLFGVFATVAVALAAIGLFGVLSYLVRQRTHEMGVRMALGATPGRLVGLVVGGALRLAVIGVAVGLAASYALTRSLSALLFGVTPTDAPTFIALPLFITFVAVAASVVPALRAGRVDPMTALRGEG